MRHSAKRTISGRTSEIATFRALGYGPSSVVWSVLLESLEMPQIPLIQGDQRSVSIAAASIVAKVYRDFLMESYHAQYPVYGFKHHRGYATEEHQAALKLYGPSPIHRKSFEGVEEPRLLFGMSGEDGGSTR